MEVTIPVAQFCMQLLSQFKSHSVLAPCLYPIVNILAVEAMHLTLCMQLHVYIAEATQHYLLVWGSLRLAPNEKPEVRGVLDIGFDCDQENMIHEIKL